MSSPWFFTITTKHTHRLERVCLCRHEDWCCKTHSRCIVFPPTIKWTRDTIIPLKTGKMGLAWIFSQGRNFSIRTPPIWNFPRKTASPLPFYQIQEKKNPCSNWRPKRGWFYSVTSFHWKENWLLILYVGKIILLTEILLQSNIKIAWTLLKHQIKKNTSIIHV